MNNINIEYISDTECKINGELWNKAETVKEERKLYFSKPIPNMTYFYIDGGVESTSWNDNRFDQCKYNTLNCWLDKSEVKAYLQRYGIYLPDKLTLAIRRWKIENGIKDRFEWGFHSKDKYYTVYNFETKTWEVKANNYMCEPLREYFSTKDTARRCLSDLQEYFDDTIKMAIQLNEWNGMTGGAESKDE